MEIFLLSIIAFSLIITYFIFETIRLKRLRSDDFEALELARNQIAELQTQNAVLHERLASNGEKEQQREELVQLFNQERNQANQLIETNLKLLVNDLLEQKSRTMTTTSIDSISALLKPLGENLERFRLRIDEESKHRFSLENEVKRLAELNLRMSQEANNLTSALKGNSKTQGDWGEMILETLLESSGLKRDLHFRVQQSILTPDGAQLRPDVILYLPDQKEVIIDSKVSLNSYIAYCEALDEQTSKRALQAHIQSLRGHIQELGAKSYQKLATSPDFVIMFVPNEPAFLIGLQGDNELWHEAYRRGVILSSPTNLFAILRIVDDLWKRDSQSKNALEIARQGGDLYDKFVGFTETFTEIGKAIKRTEDIYEKSLAQLSQGTGNLVRRAERLQKLGVKTAKSLQSQLVESGQDEDAEENMDTTPN